MAHRKHTCLDRTISTNINTRNVLEEVLDECILVTPDTLRNQNKFI